MDKHDFLGYVLPTDGHYCIGTFQNTHLRFWYYETLDETVAACDQLVANEQDVYFGCAKYLESGSRKASNAKFFRSFWIDIDVDPAGKKGYLSQQEALEALKKFCKTNGLRKPTIVNSGNGIHCYWVLDKTISYNDWKPVAEFLKALCVAQKFNVDAGCTADAARILRVPYTNNYKNRQHPKEVTVMHYGDPNSLQEFKDVIGFVEGGIDVTSHDGVDALTRSLSGNISSKFKTILEKSLSGVGCNQLTYIFTKQNEISEPLWRSGLSIAQFCVDRDKAIHKLSNQCDSYDPQDTEDKATLCKGAHTCTQFESVNPQGCVGCQLKGTFKSPIMLGKFIERATPEDNIITTMHEGLGKEVTEVIPAYPPPYFRKKNGGVMLTKFKPLATKDGSSEAKEEEEEDVEIYEHDIYVEKRLTDPDAGEVVLIKHHMPHDGIREFTAPLADILSRDKARMILAQHGVALLQNRMELVMGYLAHWVRTLQATSKAEVARSQFGWHDNDDTFLIGTRQVTADGVTFSPPSASTDEVTVHYGSSGILSQWVELANLYARPGCEPRAFALGVSLGSPFVKFSGIRGFIVHLTNETSGVGKSTVQHMANSVWGHPTTSMLTFDDKPLARQHRFGVLKNIVVCIDEITDLSAEEAGHTAFMVTQGKGRDRMQANVNAIRKNNTTWDLPVITSGNNSLHDLLYSNKVLPEGELMRILEVYIPKDDSMPKQESDRLFGQQLSSNYGLAGEIIMTYVLNNKEECVQLMYDIREEFDKRAGFEAKQRFYSSACAVAFTGLEIAKRCGLHNIDIEAVKRWAIKSLGNTIKAIKEDIKTPTSIVGEFINAHIGNMVVIDGTNGTKEDKLLKAPTMLPRGELVIRYEPNNKMVYISANSFRDWCSGRQLPFKNLCDRLAGDNILRYRGAKNLAEGLPGESAPVRALGLYLTNVTVPEAGAE